MTIASNLAEVRRRISNVGDADLLCVSKTFGPDAVREAFEAGERRFGENYVQEAIDKIAVLQDLRQQIEWHMIGPLQSNKTKLVAEQFDWVQSVDRLKIAQRLSEQRPATMPPLNLCLQVNISREASKSGVAPEDVPAIAHAITQLPQIKLRGLMAIPDPGQGDKPLRSMGELFRWMKSAGFDIDTLSMGMSADLESAIHAGATMVRIGTSVFGNR